MSKELRCSEIVPGCDEVIRADTEEEVLTRGAEHARDAHGIEEMDDATREKVKGAIRDV